jgi:hypothetical protein
MGSDPEGLRIDPQRPHLRPADEPRPTLSVLIVPENWAGSYDATANLIPKNRVIAISAPPMQLCREQGFQAVKKAAQLKRSRSDLVAEFCHLKLWRM